MHTLSPAQLNEIGQLRPDNHELWKYLQRRVLDPVPVVTIAAELGLDVDALVAWMLAYKGPKRKPYLSKNGAPIGKVRAHMPAAISKPESSAAPIPSVRVEVTEAEQIRRQADHAKYAIWRRSRDGARFAREQVQE